MAALYAVLPDNLKDTKPLRCSTSIPVCNVHRADPTDSDISASNQSLALIGQDHFNLTYGETAESVQAFLKDIYPDFGKCLQPSFKFSLTPATEFFSTTFAYGYVYAFPQVLSAAETSFAMIAALIASDTPKQLAWHLTGALRNGAHLSEVQAIRSISIEVAKASGVVWKNEIPDI
jgi:alkylhydroperoxidase/carboxymuconolactone decarboxylase family protein YurZ